MTCKKCKVNIDVPSTYCPLCGSKLEKTPNNPSYPLVKDKIIKNRFKKIVLFSELVICIACLFINYVINNHIDWSLYVLGGLASFYILFLEFMYDRKDILKALFNLSMLGMVITLVWDYILDFKGWSINFVYPSLGILIGTLIFILRITSYRRYKSHIFYIILNIILEIIPVIFLILGKITFKPLSYASILIGLINLIVLIFFGNRDLIDEIDKKGHI